MLYSFLSALLLICYKTAAGYFKDENSPSLKANDRLKISQYMVFNRVR